MLNDSRQFASVDVVEKGNWGQACDLCDFGFDRISCSARENVETHDLAADFIEQFGTATIENRTNRKPGPGFAAVCQLTRYWIALGCEQFFHLRLSQKLSHDSSLPILVYQLRRLEKIESLPTNQQTVLLKTIDTFIKAAGK